MEEASPPLRPGEEAPVRDDTELAGEETDGRTEAVEEEEEEEEEDVEDASKGSGGSRLMRWVVESKAAVAETWAAATWAASRFRPSTGLYTVEKGVTLEEEGVECRGVGEDNEVAERSDLTVVGGAAEVREEEEDEEDEEELLLVREEVTLETTVEDVVVDTKEGTGVGVLGRADRNRVGVDRQSNSP